jgi:hypothetical protein
MYNYLVEMKPLVCERCGKAIWVPYNESYLCQCIPEPSIPRVEEETALVCITAESEALVQVKEEKDG